MLIKIIIIIGAAVVGIMGGAFGLLCFRPAVVAPLSSVQVEIAPTRVARDAFDFEGCLFLTPDGRREGGRSLNETRLPSMLISSESAVVDRFLTVAARQVRVW